MTMAETAAPARPAEQIERGAAHEEDFALKTERQAALIRAGRLPYTPEQILDDDFYPGPIDEP
jgi:hypothetical protein